MDLLEPEIKLELLKQRANLITALIFLKVFNKWHFVTCFDLGDAAFRLEPYLQINHLSLT